MNETRLKQLEEILELWSHIKDEHNLDEILFSFTKCAIPRFSIGDLRELVNDARKIKELEKELEKAKEIILSFTKFKVTKIKT